MDPLISSGCVVNSGPIGLAGVTGPSNTIRSCSHFGPRELIQPNGFWRPLFYSIIGSSNIIRHSGAIEPVA